MSGSAGVRLLVSLAAIGGAAGVVLASLGAHTPDASRLTTASTMLLFHAPAALAVAALVSAQAIARMGGLLAGFGVMVGAVLFAGDLSVRHFYGVAPWLSAAPTGGTIIIFSWATLAVCAMWPRRG